MNSIETARQLASEMKAILSKYKASAYLTQTEVNDGSAILTIRIMPPMGKGVAIDPTTVTQEISKQ